MQPVLNSYYLDMQDIFKHSMHSLLIRLLLEQRSKIMTRLKLVHMHLIGIGQVLPGPPALNSYPVNV